MNLENVEHVTGSQIREFETSSGNFGASLVGCEVKEGQVLRGAVGFGTTPEEARLSLAIAVSNQCVVKNAYTSERKEFNLPKIAAV